MFDLETTKTLRKTRKKNLGSFLAMLFCTLVIVSTMGNSFGIRNSYAQQQQQQQPQTQQPSILTYHSPLSNNLRNSYPQQQLQNQQPSTVANSSAQQQLQNQQPSTVALSPWSNNLQAICGHGVCSGTANSGNTQNNHSGNTHWHNNNIVSSMLTTSSSPTKSLDLTHEFTSTKIIGPDRFRFIN